MFVSSKAVNNTNIIVVVDSAGLVMLSIVGDLAGNDLVEFLLHSIGKLEPELRSLSKSMPELNSSPRHS